MDVSTPRLMRSRDDAIIAGVAGGIARYLGVDSAVVRLIFVALAFTGAGVLLYPLLWIVMPLERTCAPQRPTQDPGREDETFARNMSASRLRASSQTDTSDDNGSEIPVNNLNTLDPRRAAPYAQRNRQVGRHPHRHRHIGAFEHPARSSVWEIALPDRVDRCRCAFVAAQPALIRISSLSDSPSSAGRNVHPQTDSTCSDSIFDQAISDNHRSNQVVAPDTVERQHCKERRVERR